MKTAVLKGCLLIIVLPFFFVSYASAAIINFEHRTDVVQVGDVFTVDLVLNTDGKQINAIEGEVLYSRDQLRFIRVLDGESVINFWVQKPEQHESDSIVFGGITPGGMTGRDLQVLTVEFEAVKEGVGSVMIQDVQLLLHDGAGTPLEATLVPLSFNILGQSTVPSVTTTYIDTESPEPFVPIVTSDPDVFEGRLFLVFATEDKGSGIDYYEVKEGKFASYELATSPYEIKDQTFSKELSVRAVDRAGNEYVAVIYPQSTLAWYETTLAKTAILIGCLVLLLLLSRRFFTRVPSR